MGHVEGNNSRSIMNPLERYSAVSSTSIVQRDKNLRHLELPRSLHHSEANRSKHGSK